MARSTTASPPTSRRRPSERTITQATTPKNANCITRPKISASTSIAPPRSNAKRFQFNCRAACRVRPSTHGPLNPSRSHRHDPCPLVRLGPRDRHVGVQAVARALSRVASVDRRDSLLSPQFGPTRECPEALLHRARISRVPRICLSRAVRHVCERRGLPYRASPPTPRPWTRRPGWSASEAGGPGWPVAAGRAACRVDIGVVRGRAGLSVRRLRTRSRQLGAGSAGPQCRSLVRLTGLG